MPAVRRAAGRKAARTSPRPPPGAVLDGRDIGTVVCPDAAVKLYVTASAEVRAGAGSARSSAMARHGRFRRNPRRHRAPRRARHGPRRLAAEAGADAHLLDTSEMDIEAAFLAAMAIIDEAHGRTETRPAAGYRTCARDCRVAKYPYAGHEPACQHSFMRRTAAMKAAARAFEARNAGRQNATLTHGAGPADRPGPSRRYQCPSSQSHPRRFRRLLEEVLFRRPFR